MDPQIELVVRDTHYSGGAFTSVGSERPALPLWSKGTLWSKPPATTTTLLLAELRDAERILARPLDSLEAPGDLRQQRWPWKPKAYM